MLTLFDYYHTHAINFAHQGHYYISPAPSIMESAGLSELAGRFKTELESTMNFWLTHSHDLKHG